MVQENPEYIPPVPGVGFPKPVVIPDLATLNTLYPPSEVYRGWFGIVKSSVLGRADELYQCKKDASDVFVWDKQVGEGDLVYGEIYVQGGSASQTLTNLNQWYKLTQFTADGLFSGMTPDHTNDQIEVDEDGLYLAVLNASFSGSVSSTFELQLQKDGGTGAYPNVYASKKLNATGDVSSVGCHGIVELNAGETIEVWARCTDGAGKDIAVEEATLSLYKLAPASKSGQINEIFFSLPGRIDNEGDYAVIDVSQNGDMNASWSVPFDFDSLVEVALIAICSTQAAQAGRDIDIFSDYANLGEDAQTHSEADTTTLYDLSGKGNKIIELPLNGIFSNLAPGDRCGCFIDHNSIGGIIHYINLRFKYVRA